MTVVTTAASTSSTLPSCKVIYTDVDSGASVTRILISTSTGNTVGAFGPSATTAPMILYAASGTAVQYSTASYASSGGTAMQYAVRVRLEQMQ